MNMKSLLVTALVTTTAATSLWLQIEKHKSVEDVMQDRYSVLMNDYRILSNKYDDLTGRYSTLSTTRMVVTSKNKELSESLKQLQDRLMNMSTKYILDEFVVTAYAPYDDRSGINSDGSPNSTATGTRPHTGTFAVDPRIIPYGSTVILIYEDGTIERGVAEDTGGAIKGNRLDVFRKTYKTAMRFGKRKAQVIWYNESN